MTPKSASIHEDPRSSASVPRTPISRSPCPSTPTPSPVPPIPKIEFDLNGVPRNMLGGLDAVWSTAQDVSFSNMTPYSSPINKNNVLPPLKPKIIPRIIPQVKVSPASKEKQIKNAPIKPTSANDSNQLTIPNDKSKKLRTNHNDSYGTTTMLNNPVNKKSASEVAKRTNLVKFTSCCPMLKLVKRCY